MFVEKTSSAAKRMTNVTETAPNAKRPNPSVKRLQELCREDPLYRRPWNSSGGAETIRLSDVDKLIQDNKKFLRGAWSFLIPVYGPIKTIVDGQRQLSDAPADTWIGVAAGLMMSPFALAATAIPILPYAFFKHSRQIHEYEALQKELRAQGIQEVAYPD